MFFVFFSPLFLSLRDTSEAKSVFKQALLAHAKRQKSVAREEDEDEVKQTRHNESPRKQFTQAQGRHTKRDQEIPGDFKGKYRNNPRRQAGSRRKGSDSDTETTASVSVNRPTRQNGRSASSGDQQGKGVGRFKERTTKAEIHNVLSRRGVDGRRAAGRDRDIPGSSNREQRNVPSGVNKTQGTVGNKAKKPLLRRVSSSSVVDENGHLKPYDDNDDDDDDDDDDDEDDDDEDDISEASSVYDEDVKRGDDDDDEENKGSHDDDDDDVNDDEVATPTDDDRSVHSEFSEEPDMERLSDNEDDDDVDDVGNSDENDEQALRRGNPRISATQHQKSVSAKNRNTEKSKTKETSNKNSDFHLRKQIERKIPTAQIEIIDESTPAKLAKIGKSRNNQIFQQPRKSRENSPPRDKNGEEKEREKRNAGPENDGRSKYPGHQNSKTRGQVNVGKKKGGGNNVDPKKGNRVHEKLRRTFSQSSSNGQVPTITVEDFSGNSSSVSPEVQQSPEVSNGTPSGMKSQNWRENNGASVGNRITEKKTKLEVAKEGKDQDNKPSWLKMKLRPVSKEKKPNTPPQSNSDALLPGNSKGKSAKGGESASANNIPEGSIKAESDGSRASTSNGLITAVSNSDPDQAQNALTNENDSSVTEVRDRAISHQIDNGEARRKNKDLPIDQKNGMSKAAVKSKDKPFTQKDAADSEVVRKGDKIRDKLDSPEVSNRPDQQPNSKTKALGLLKSKIKSNVKNSAKDKQETQVSDPKPSEKATNSPSNPGSSKVNEYDHRKTESSHNEKSKANLEKSKVSSSGPPVIPKNNLKPNGNQPSSTAGEPSDTTAVFTFDEPVFLSAPSGNNSPDIPANFGRFRSDRPSLANIYADADENTQNGGGVSSDVIPTDQSESGREDSADEDRKSPLSRRRQRVFTGNGNNFRRLSSSTPVQHRETSALPNGQRFTVLAITNGDLHLEATDEDD